LCFHDGRRTGYGRHLLRLNADFQSARDAVCLARRVLQDAELRFDKDCLPDNTILLMSEIRMAERRLADAVSVLDEARRSDTTQSR